MGEQRKRNIPGRENSTRRGWETEGKADWENHPPLYPRSIHFRRAGQWEEGEGEHRQERNLETPLCLAKGCGSQHVGGAAPSKGHAAIACEDAARVTHRLDGRGQDTAGGRGPERSLRHSSQGEMMRIPLEYGQGKGAGGHPDHSDGVHTLRPLTSSLVERPPAPAKQCMSQSASLSPRSWWPGHRAGVMVEMETT